jgi:hypothetical protein
MFIKTILLLILKFNEKEREWNKSKKKENSLMHLPSFYEHNKFVLHPEVIDERDVITFIDLGQD